MRVQARARYTARVIARLNNYALYTALGLLVLSMGVVLYVFAITRSFIFDSRAQHIPHAQVAVVLGASVTSAGVLSPVLQERVDTALALYRAHLVSKILVTGDNSSIVHNEVYPVGKYLLAVGVPQKDIFLDYAGFDTYSSMYRARTIFGVQSMIVVTQRFHLPRAIFISRMLGMDAYGVDASGMSESYVGNAIREIPATVKAGFDLLSARTPQYLGVSFPIEGSGLPTWVGDPPDLIYFRSGS